MISEISYDIITRTVLNEASGELEQVDFRQVKERTQIKGGFGMYYKSYEETIEHLIDSKLDWKIWVAVKNHFTWRRVETSLDMTKLAKDLGCSRAKIGTVVKKAVEIKLLLRVSRGIYRLNPFMILPYRADGAELQAEWLALVSEEPTKKVQP